MEIWKMYKYLTLKLYMSQGWNVWLCMHVSMSVGKHEGLYVHAHISMSLYVMYACNQMSLGVSMDIYM